MLFMCWSVDDFIASLSLWLALILDILASHCFSVSAASLLCLCGLSLIKLPFYMYLIGPLSVRLSPCLNHLASLCSLDLAALLVNLRFLNCSSLCAVVSNAQRALSLASLSFFEGSLEHNSCTVGIVFKVYSIFL